MDLNLLLEGLQLQLAVYLSAALELEQRKHPDLQAETCRYVLLPGGRPPDSGNARGEPGGNPPVDPGCPEAGRPVPLGRGDSESAGRRADLSGKILCNPVSFKKDGALSRTSGLPVRSSFWPSKDLQKRKSGRSAEPFWKDGQRPGPTGWSRRLPAITAPTGASADLTRGLPGFEYRRIRKKSEEEVLKQMREEAE